MEKIVISSGISTEEESKTLSLIYDTFSEKFKIGITKYNEFYKVFSSQCNFSICIAAYEGSELIGILTYKDSDGEFFDVSLSKLFRSFNPFKAIKILINFALLSHGVKGNEMYIDSVSVSPSHRGQGVGTKLLDAIEDLAMEKGKTILSLYVIGTNEGAKRLYERKGFVTVGEDKGYFVKKLTGAEKAYKMEKKLSPPTGGK